MYNFKYVTWIMLIDGEVLLFVVVDPLLPITEQKDVLT